MLEATKVMLDKEGLKVKKVMLVRQVNEVYKDHL